MDLRDVVAEMEEAVSRGVFPGAVLLVRNRERVVFHRAFGCRCLEPQPAPMREDTIFDLSSLTKPLATTLAFMLLVREGRVRLEDRVTRFFFNFAVHGKSRITYRHLLAHCSGLPAWRPYYRDVLKLEHRGRVNFVSSRDAKEHVYQQVHRERVEAPPGTRVIYSDLGFILLGETVELLGHMSLDRFCHERIYRPLGLRSIAFVDLSHLRVRRLTPIADMIASTERCPWRRRILCGEVHDDNAFAMGGVAGHAGLFASAADVDALLVHFEAVYAGAAGLVPRSLLQEFWRRDETVPGSTWALGWDTPASDSSSAGHRFSPHSVGHLGYTGTSVWIDLERGIHVILLTNRVHPSRDNDRLREFRPQIHDRLMEALGF